MNPSRSLIGGVLRAADAVSPDLAGWIAYRLFFSTRPRMPLRDADAATDLAAERTIIRVRGRDVVAYRWGAGAAAALVVHGWRGRASQFAPLVRELVAQGMTVVSFDAPAHGASGGRRTDIRDWLDAIARLRERHGAFDLVVAHSVGGVAALAAARGQASGRVAVIAGAGGPQPMIDRFALEGGLSAAAKVQLERLFHARIDETAASAARRFDAVAHPLPAGIELLVVHDRDDRRLPDADAIRLHRAHGPRSRLLRTEGLGHNRILRDDAVLDAVLAFAGSGTSGLDDVVTHPLHVSLAEASERGKPA
ncbi:alpha/beta hydrolase [Microbacterium sp. JZ101]